MGVKVEINRGDRYGRLMVMEEIAPVLSATSGKRYRCFRFLCDCGEVVERRLESVRALGQGSCGCLRRETARSLGKRTTHGLSKSGTYETWAMMKRRCYNPGDSSFGNYGGRGIGVCHRWRWSFGTFLEDMGERPDGTSIERIDNDGQYEPGNCRWATNTEQARNRRSNKMLTFQGETMCVSAWAERIGLPRKTLEKRLNRHGYTIEEALTLPLRARRPS